MIELLRAIIELQNLQIQALLDHCSENECSVCAKIICPFEDDLHLHHDGCPSCAEHYES